MYGSKARRVRTAGDLTRFEIRLRVGRVDLDLVERHAGLLGDHHRERGRDARALLEARHLEGVDAVRPELQPDVRYRRRTRLDDRVADVFVVDRIGRRQGQRSRFGRRWSRQAGSGDDGCGSGSAQQPPTADRNGRCGSGQKGSSIHGDTPFGVDARPDSRKNAATSSRSWRLAVKTIAAGRGRANRCKRSATIGSQQIHAVRVVGRAAAFRF